MMKLLFKNIIAFKVIVVILLAALAGCTSSKIEYVEENALPKKRSFEIIEIYMNDGRVINVNGKDAKLKLNYKGDGDSIVYVGADAESILKLKDIDRLKIEVLGNSVAAITIVNVALVIVGVILALALLIGRDGFKMH